MNNKLRVNPIMPTPITPTPDDDRWAIWLTGDNLYLDQIHNPANSPRLYHTEQEALDVARGSWRRGCTGRRCVVNAAAPHRHRMTLIDAVGDEIIIPPSAPDTAPRPARP
jgi:hypothetical protein